MFLMTDSLDTGGSEKQFVTLAKALSASCGRVSLGCLQRRGALLDQVESIQEFPLGGSFLSRQGLRSYSALRRHLQAERIAIAHAFDYYTNMVLAPVSRWAGVPGVIGSHRQIGDLLTPLQFGAQRTVLTLCDRVVCNSRKAAERLADHGLAEDKLVVIPNALPDEFFAKTTAALPRRPGVLRVGLIARMNHLVKNHSMFLRAASRLAPQFPSLEFLLVGDGPLRPALEQTAERLGVGGRVRFLGDCRDIAAVLAAMDISVVASSSESLSNVILESMASGVPVVATRVGGNPEVVHDGETGLLIPPDDEDRLVEAIERLLRQPLLRMNCSERAKEFARANFSLARISRQFENLYEDLLEEKGWPPCSKIAVRHTTGGASAPVRVAIVAASPRWIGGHGVQADLLMHHWTNDPAVEAQFVPIDPEWPRWLAWVEGIPLLRTVLRTPFYLWALWRGIREVEIVHIFSASYWSFLLAPLPAWLIARLWKKKTVINYHSGEARDHLLHWRTALPILRRADCLVVPSQFLVDVFHEFGLEAKAVPNIVDLNQFAYRPRHPLRPALVCTRGFGPYYSVDLVVRAYARIKKQFPMASLCLVGKGPQEKAIRSLVQESNLPDVEFAGAVPHHEIPSYYDRADIFINASWLDNMPLSILEAFAAGTPVVSTAPDGIRYLVKNERTGLLCATGDWQALADNVMRLLRDPELANRLAQNAYSESIQYRWAAVRDQWVQVYRSLFSPQVPADREEEWAREQPPLPIPSQGFDLSERKRAGKF